MSNLTWSRSELASIDYFYLFHTCQGCNTVIGVRQAECCKSNKFQLNFKLQMTVIWDKSPCEVITKSVDVVRVLFHAHSEEEWNLWLDGFKRVRKFFLNKSVNYNPAADSATPEQVRKFKQLLNAYLYGFNKRTFNYTYEMKYRILSKAFPYKESKNRYYCIAARWIKTEV